MAVGIKKTAGMVTRNGCHEEIQVGIESVFHLATRRMVILEMNFMTCDQVIVESDLEQLWQVGDISEVNCVVAAVMAMEILLILLATVVSLVTIGCLVTIFSCISAGREYHIPQL